MTKQIIPPKGMMVVATPGGTGSREYRVESLGECSDENGLHVQHLHGGVRHCVKAWRHLTDEEVQTLIGGRELKGSDAQSQIEQMCINCTYGELSPSSEPCFSCARNKDDTLSNWSRK
jgi:hypothetical protein